MSSGRALSSVLLRSSFFALATASALGALGACGDTVTVPDQADSGVLTIACTSASCVCPDGRTCVMTCPKGATCSAQCGKGSSCDIDCAESTDCSARCLESSKGTVRRKTGSSPIVTSAAGGDCKVCLGECTK